VASPRSPSSPPRRVGFIRIGDLEAEHTGGLILFDYPSSAVLRNRPLNLTLGLRDPLAYTTSHLLARSFPKVRTLTAVIVYDGINLARSRFPFKEMSSLDIAFTDVSDWPQWSPPMGEISQIKTLTHLHLRGMWCARRLRASSSILLSYTSSSVSITTMT
jgi:hypothetical protein